jgi:hypothetical protein
LTKHLRNEGYAGKASISGVASICIGDLNMPKQQNNESTHFFFTIRSRTTRTGQVTRLTTKGECERKALACVADIFTYDDGSEATIIDGAGLPPPGMVRRWPWPVRV